MKKYLQLARITFQEYFVYRLNFILWRLRSLVQILALFFFWLAIFKLGGEFLSYGKEEMLTYLVGIVFLKSFVLASRTANLAGRIKSGSLTKELIRPWGIFKSFFTCDLVDKALNLVFAVAEIGLIFYYFKFTFFFPKSFWNIVAFLVVILISVFLYFFISLWISTFSFWTDQPWAARWLFGVIFLDFLAGAYFPLDILPPVFGKIASLTPFPYLIYFPIKIWLEQITGIQLVKPILISLLWLIAFWFILKKTWEKGLRNYAAYDG